MSYDLYFMPTGNSIRVILLLEALGVNYNKHLHNPFIGDKVDPNLNPTGKVPAIFDMEHDVSMFESGNILLHLCEKHDKDGHLLPRTLKERSPYLSWLFKIVGETQTVKQVFISSTMTAATHHDKEVFIDRAGRVFHQYLKAFERQMEKNNNGHLLGDHYNLLDIALISLLYDFDQTLFPIIGGNNNEFMQMYLSSKWLILDTVDMAKYPHLNAFLENVKKDRKLVKTIKADYHMWTD